MSLRRLSLQVGSKVGVYNPILLRVYDEMQMWCNQPSNLKMRYLRRLFPTATITKKKHATFYRERIVTICQELEDIFSRSHGQDIHQLYSNIYSGIPKEFSIPSKPSLEIVLNIIMFGMSLGMPWSYYLIFFPTGRQLIENVFIHPTDVNALSNLLNIMKSVYVTDAYDDILFRREFQNIVGTFVLPEAINSAFTKLAIDKATPLPLIINRLEKLIMKTN